MDSNFQSFVFIELIEKTWVRGALFVAGRSILGPKSSRSGRVDKAQGGGQNEKASQIQHSCPSGGTGRRASFRS
jgi:hypothetical protein